MKKTKSLLISLSFVVAVSFSANSRSDTQPLQYVILISVDGLLPSAITKLGASELPGFYRFRNEGAWTDNARTDYDYTRTLPNHASIISARRVLGEDGHGQTLNDMPAVTTTLHNNTGEESYVSSLFDVAHDAGLSTALYASKDKFILFAQSYNAENGAEDLVDQNDGKNKIDRYTFLQENRAAQVLVDRFVEDMSNDPFNLSMIHLLDPDAAGHGENWQSDNYYAAVKRVDRYLQTIFSLVENSTSLNGHTAIVLVADHGGSGQAHSDEKNPLNYTTPFYVWGEGVAQGIDLYALNKTTRKDPATSRPDYQSKPQPIRNSDAANLVLMLLGLASIPDNAAQINAQQDLKVTD
ncbi:alkaline phosphatase family protein, partial [Arenicella sp.]|nr:alkaline phosphatase family protein [Arenicella sp.]